MKIILELILFEKYSIFSTAFDVEGITSIMIWDFRFLKFLVEK
jgi:hypothetical protein